MPPWCGTPVEAHRRNGHLTCSPLADQYVDPWVIVGAADKPGGAPLAWMPLLLGHFNS